MVHQRNANQSERNTNAIDVWIPMVVYFAFVLLYRTHVDNNVFAFLPTSWTMYWIGDWCSLNIDDPLFSKGFMHCCWPSSWWCVTYLALFGIYISQHVIYAAEVNNAWHFPIISNHILHHATAVSRAIEKAYILLHSRRRMQEMYISDASSQRILQVKEALVYAHIDDE